MQIKLDSCPEFWDAINSSTSPNPARWRYSTIHIQHIHASMSENAPHIAIQSQQLIRIPSTAFQPRSCPAQPLTLANLFRAKMNKEVMHSAE